MRSPRYVKVDSTTLHALESLMHALEKLVGQIRKEIKKSRRGAQSQTVSSERQLSLPLSDMTDQP
ncbi:MAG: hypothetical protein D6823_06130 [Chloroflexi bacterium]|jgi:hypothetical protein|nr:MAG: hypothetical protein D6823_06130 [Chloroflexota bacterium]